MRDRVREASGMHFPLRNQFQEWKGNMPADPFDILRRHRDGSFIWLEAAADIRLAKARLQELWAGAPGEYFVFDQGTQQIVAKFPGLPAKD